jgi:quercetin dioxygenase-like cupin family protein
MPQFLLTVNDVAPAPVRQQDGWKNMDIRFLITRETVGSDKVCFWRTVFTAASAHEKHRHRNSAEVVYCISGQGYQGIGDEEYEIRPGSVVYIPKTTVHWTRTTGPMEIVGLYTEVGSLEESGYEFLEHLTL